MRKVCITSEIRELDVTSAFLDSYYRKPKFQKISLAEINTYCIAEKKELFKEFFSERVESKIKKIIDKVNKTPKLKSIAGTLSKALNAEKTKLY